MTSLTVEQKKDILRQTRNQLSQIKKDRPDLRDDLQYLDDVLRMNVVEWLVHYNAKKGLADYMPELTKKLHTEIRKIAETDYNYIHYGLN